MLETLKVCEFARCWAKPETLKVSDTESSVENKGLLSLKRSVAVEYHFERSSATVVNILREHMNILLSVDL